MTSPPADELRRPTRVGHSKPGRRSQNVPTGIRASLVSIAIGVAGQQAGQSEDVANEPNHHDGEDDLKEACLLRWTISVHLQGLCLSGYLQETF